jgi:hypothetical protein
VEIKNSDNPPHAKRGWLKNNNTPGDFFTAPRCGARTRRETPCRAPAMKNGRCRMHGGMSPGGPVGNQHALKHGLRTQKAILERRAITQLLKDCQDLIEEVDSGA